MKILIGTLAAVGILCAIILIASYICFRLAFYVRGSAGKRKEIEPILTGEDYDCHRDIMLKWYNETQAYPHTEYFITSFDGTLLCGKFYEYQKGAPIELMFHGYRGTAERDLSGGMQRCFSLGHSAFIVDQRCSGKSGGNVITFGIKERRDCLCWIDFIIKTFGYGTKIILAGISMGATTVLLAAGEELPDNVVGVLADCGFSSAEKIIKKVIGQLGLPIKLCYPLVRLGAYIYGGFNLHETTAIETLKRCKIPVIFFHGESDDFVPCCMSQENFDACKSEKRIVTIPAAAHGLSFLIDPERYLDEMRDFFGDI